MNDQYQIMAAGSRLVAHSLINQTLVRRGGSKNQTSEISIYVQKLFQNCIQKPAA